MGKQLATIQTGALPATLADLASKARDYMRSAKSDNTQRAYRSDWQAFAEWCDAAALPSLPASPETVGLYLAAMADTLKPATLGRRLVAIQAAHRAKGLSLDTRHAAIRETLAGIKRTHGTAQQGKAPTMTADIRAMIAAQPGTLLGTRNRALLLLGFAGAFRRSELVALDIADLSFGRDGLTVTQRRGKTDQEGRGRIVGIPYGSTPATCPVRAVQDWIEAGRLDSGALFRHVGPGKSPIPGDRLSDKAVALIVKRAARLVGLDASRFAGHSLRAGLATSAAMAGASERAIMDQTGHKSLPMVRRYIRSGNLFKENAAAVLGL
jgi:integrase